jgi:hypothetical protein
MLCVTTSSSLKIENYNLLDAKMFMFIAQNQYFNQCQNKLKQLVFSKLQILF